ncbi:triose-phosphate isomerase [Geoalkalibacter sp.]|uniref:triose-phosphate isomerase n=1 Tax=Geoalkalibacter sp. TaxID=3041440 RepID=UPI00272E0E4A|nr:triose-phosphate isomerase [Geoalkalibacter sp.]
MRKPLIAGNWKLHKTIPEALELVEALKQNLADITDVEVVVAPVFTALVPVAKVLEGSSIVLAAQNCYFENNGAFTGEVSPALLKDAGCSHVILGHSERRQLFGETDELINRKVKAVLAEGLTPIFCIGETLEERENDEMMDVLKRQVTVGLKGLSESQMLNVVVAYEPVWAIGTGKTATGEQAQVAHAFVRGLLAGLFGTPLAEQVRILYGGSVKPDNVDGLMAQMDIDGTLVGGASLKAGDFIRIARFEKN